MSKTVIALGTILLAVCSICIAEGCQVKQNKCSDFPEETEVVEKVVEKDCTETMGQLKQILKRLSEKTEKMRTFQSKIHYLYIPFIGNHDVGTFYIPMDNIFIMCCF